MNFRSNFLVPILFIVSACHSSTLNKHTNETTSDPDLSGNSFSIPGLDEVESIFVLDYDHGDYFDQDGMRDPVRVTLWQRNKANSLEAIGIEKYALITDEIFSMLSNTGYKTVDSETWHHNYHRIAGGFNGGLITSDGQTIGWKNNLGGMGYFDFNFPDDPCSEKLYCWKAKKSSENDLVQKKIYRVRTP